MSTINTYKPRDDARVKAVLFTQKNCLDLSHGWAAGQIYYSGVEQQWRVNTLEGWVHIPFGHYLIQGMNGEFYPCDPDVFQKRWMETDT